MSDLAYRLLDPAELEHGLLSLKGWAVLDGRLAKTFPFDDYRHGLVFAAAVGHLAETLNHHPDILIGYRKVTVAMSTHDVGGLSPYDLELARRIDDAL